MQFNKLDFINLCKVSFAIYLIFQCFRLTLKLVAKTTVTNTGDDRIRTIELSGDERISVQSGDLIGLYLPVNDGAELPYTSCLTRNSPTEGNHWKSEAASVNVDTEYTFVEDERNHGQYNCRTWSLNAYIIYS